MCISIDLGIMITAQPWPLVRLYAVSREPIHTGQLLMHSELAMLNSTLVSCRWSGLPGFLSAKRSPLYCDNDDTTAAFVKRHKNLSFFWLMNAGHRVTLSRMLFSLLLSTPFCNSLLSAHLAIRGF